MRQEQWEWLFIQAPGEIMDNDGNLFTFINNYDYDNDEIVMVSKRDKSGEIVKSSIFYNYTQLSKEEAADFHKCWSVWNKVNLKYQIIK